MRTLYTIMLFLFQVFGYFQRPRVAVPARISNRSKIVVLALATLFSQSVAAQMVPAFQDKRVNDFANIYSVQFEQQLEAELAKYDRDTTVEIVVVTWDNLRREPVREWSKNLFNTWGIGKRDKNNGVLLVIALDDGYDQGDIWIAIGDGFGYHFTERDATSCVDEGLNQIANRNQRGYEIGTNEIVGAVQRRLRKYVDYQQQRAREERQRFEEEQRRLRETPGERAERLRKEQRAREIEEEQRAQRLEQERLQREREEKEAAEARKGFLIMTGLFIGAVAIGFATWTAIRAVKERSRKKKLYRQVMDATYVARGSAEDLTVSIESRRRSLGSRSFPEWARQEAEEELKKAEQQINSIDGFISNIRGHASDDPDKADDIRKQMEKALEDARSCINAVETSIPEKIRRYQDNAPIIVQASTSLLEEVAQELAGSKGNGFRFPDKEKELESRRNVLDDLDSQLTGTTPDYRNIYNKAEETRTAVAGMLESMRKTVGLRGQNETFIISLSEKTRNLRSGLGEYDGMLAYLKRNAAPANWEDVWREASNVAGLLDECEFLIRSARKKNSMAEQDFQGASNDLENADLKLTRVGEILKSVEQRQKGVVEAKAFVERDLEKVKQQVRNALERSRHSDAGSESERKAKEASGFLDSVSTGMSGDVIDWLILRSLLNNASQTAASAHSLADSSISAAKRRRDQRSSSSSFRVGGSTVSRPSSGYRPGGGMTGGRGGGRKF